MGECSRVHTQRVGVQPLSSVAVSRYWTRKGLGFNLSHDAPGNIALQARVSACRGQVFINARARRSCRRRTDLGQKDIKLPTVLPRLLKSPRNPAKIQVYEKPPHAWSASASSRTATTQPALFCTSCGTPRKNQCPSRDKIGQEDNSRFSGANIFFKTGLL